MQTRLSTASSRDLIFKVQMKGSTRGPDSQPCPDPRLGLSSTPLPCGHPLGSHQGRLALNSGAGHCTALPGDATWACVAPHRASAGWPGSEILARSKRAREQSSARLPGGAGEPGEAPVLISLSTPAKQGRLSSNSGFIPIRRRRIGPRCFVALGKY